MQLYPHRLFRLCVFPLFIKSAFSLSSVPYLNLITMSARGVDSSHDLTTIRRSQSALARRWWHRGKIPARTKKRRRTKNPSWISVLPPCCLSDPSRPGTARGGNCIKVDVGYARAAPSVRGIINSQRRAVTKVRACSLVSRSVSGQANSSSPSSFRHLHHFTSFFLSLSLENL